MLGCQLRGSGRTPEGRIPSERNDDPDSGRLRILYVLVLIERSRRRISRHLYVLIPVLDEQKHHSVWAPAVEKLLRHGEGWLPGHPGREHTSRRYLARQPSLTREALRQQRCGSRPGCPHSTEKGRMKNPPAPDLSQILDPR